MVTPTSCRLCSRFCAVTMICSSAPRVVCVCAAAGAAATNSKAAIRTKRGIVLSPPYCGRGGPGAVPAGGKVRAPLHDGIEASGRVLVRERTGTAGQAAEFPGCHAEGIPEAAGHVRQVVKAPLERDVGDRRPRVRRIRQGAAAGLEPQVAYI